MSFELPLYLAALSAVLIPIFLHLYNRRRASVHHFAAIEFIVLSNKNLLRRLKLRQFLVLLARIALILAAVLAMSKPFTHTEGFGVLAPVPPTATVLVFDNSLSMLAGSREKNNLEHARELARKWLEDVGPHDMVALVLASKPARALVTHLTYDKQRVAQALAKVTASTRTTDLLGALRLAESILYQGNLTRKQIVLVSDQARHAWQKVSNPWSLERVPLVRRIVARLGNTTNNVGIESVTVAAAPQVSADHFTVDVRVANFGQGSFNRPIKLVLPGKTLQGYLEQPLKAGGRGTKRFLIKIRQTAPVVGRAELPDDALRWDNRVSFVVNRPRQIRVLLVNGAPRTVPYLDESYFVRLALRPGPKAVPSVSVQQIKSDELGGQRLEDIDVVVLLNVPTPTKAIAKKLEAFVRAGRGLFIAAGGNVTAAYNQPLKALLPYSIRGVKVAGAGDIKGGALRVLFFANMKTEHPVFRVFRASGSTSFRAGRTKQYLLLERRMPAARLLWSFDNGAPALAERRVGQGRVLFFATTLDRDWSTFAIQGGFLPFIHHALRYLGRQRIRRMIPEVLTHASIRIPIGSGSRMLRVRMPGGRTRTFGLIDSEKRRQVRFDDTAVPGVYRIERVLADNAVETDLFVVTPGIAESDLRPLSAAQIEARLLQGRVRTLLAGKPAAPSRQRLDLWPFAIVTLLVLLFAETLLIAKR